MSQTCPNNGRFPTGTEPFIISIALLQVITRLDPDQLQALITLGELAGFTQLIHTLFRRSP